MESSNRQPFCSSVSCIRSQKIEIHKDIKSFNELIPEVVCVYVWCVCVMDPMLSSDQVLLLLLSTLSPPHCCRDVYRNDVEEVVVSSSSRLLVIYPTADQ